MAVCGARLIAVPPRLASRAHDLRVLSAPRSHPGRISPVPYITARAAEIRVQLLHAVDAAKDAELQPAATPV